MSYPFRLITNVKYADLMVNGRPLRMFCHALLLETVPMLPGEPWQPQVRVYGRNFDTMNIYPLGCRQDDYRMTDQVGVPYPYEDATEVELPTMIRLKFGDGTVINVETSKQSQPLSIVDFPNMERVRTRMQRDILEYWTGSLLPIAQ